MEYYQEILFKDGTMPLAAIGPGYIVEGKVRYKGDTKYVLTRWPMANGDEMPMWIVEGEYKFRTDTGPGPDVNYHDKC